MPLRFTGAAKATTAAADIEVASGGSGAFPNTYSVSFTTNDSIRVADGFLTSYGSDTTGTVSAWVYCTDVSATNFPIITFHNNAITRYLRLMQFSGRLHAGLWNGSAWDWIVDTDNSDITVNTWHHVALVQDGVEPVLYVDGVATDQAFVISTDKTTWMSAEAFTKTDIGAFVPASQYFEGLIDELAYTSNTALSAAQILSIYNSGVPADLSSYSPVGWWRMGDNDGGTGTTVTDQGSGSNDGTLTNGPTFSTNIPS